MTAVFTKTFGTTSGAYNSDSLWLPINIRSSSYAWTVSGSGTNEYYVRTAANANPGFQASPPTSNGVFINGSAATKASLGSLAAGNWGYGDNDTLGYSTVYVRLSDGTDPDTKTDNYVYFQQMPQATENVRFAADSGSINSATGIDQSATTINDFIVERNYAGTIGSATLGPLLITASGRFEFNGSSECWIDLSASAIQAHILGTANASPGLRGLYLRGSAISTLNVMGGAVGLASRPGTTSTATTIRLMGADSSLWVGNGVTVTNVHQFAGEMRLRCGATTVILYGGTHITEENGAMTTVTQKGGIYTWQSSGNITTFNLYGGTLDMLKSAATRTLSTLNKYSGSSQILRNKEAVTITTETPQDSYSETIASVAS